MIRTTDASRPLQRDAGPASVQTVRVAHVVISMEVGGLERNVANQARHAGRLGQEFDVVCLERRGELAARVEEAGGRVVCLDKPPGLTPRLVARLRDEFRRTRPDVVHTHQANSLFYGATAARLAGVPAIVHTEHGKHYAGNRSKSWVGYLGAVHVSRFYCLSRDMADEVIAAGVAPPRKVSAIFNGIDLGRFRDPGDPDALREALGIPPGVPVIGTAGRLAEIKRQDVLIRAFAALRGRVPSAHLVLVGEGPLRDDLASLARSLGVSDAVHFAGYTDEPQRYHHLFDVFALTSRSEGTPQALIESGVAGRPAIATRVGGIPEMIDNGLNGLLVEPGDVDAFANSLHRLLTDPDLARRIGEANRERVEARHDIGRMAEMYHRDYLDLLAGR